MRIFTKKNIMKNIMIILVLITIVTFSVPNYIYAADDIGGTLLKPIKQLLGVIGDAIMYAVQGVVIQDVNYISFFTEPDVRDGDYWDDTNDNHVVFPGFLILTPQTIFSNRISILNPDFINEIDTTGKIEGNTYKSDLEELRVTIATWYVAIRNLALVGLLSVLVYIGIRIILSSTAGEKAKYKQMIQYWVTSIVLLFILQYIMSFTLILTKELTKIFIGEDEVVVMPTTLDYTDDGTAIATKFKIKDQDAGGSRDQYAAFIAYTDPITGEKRFDDTVQDQLYDGTENVIRCSKSNAIY